MKGFFGDSCRVRMSMIPVRKGLRHLTESRGKGPALTSWKAEWRQETVDWCLTHPGKPKGPGQLVALWMDWGAVLWKVACSPQVFRAVGMGEFPVDQNQPCRRWLPDAGVKTLCRSRQKTPGARSSKLQVPPGEEGGAGCKEPRKEHLRSGYCQTWRARTAPVQ